MNRIVSIQLLRALACLLVLMVHIIGFNALTIGQLNGAIGVDIFFIISGYIIAGSLGRLPDEQPTKTFLVNRFTRVAPYYYVLTVLYAVALWLTGSQWPTGQALLASLAFVARHGADPVHTLGWSLNHEVFFYSFVALTLLFTRNVKKIALAFAFLLGVLQLIPKPIELLREMAASINIEFLFGMLIYLYRDKMQVVFRHWGFLVLASILLLVVMRVSTDVPIPKFKAFAPAEAYARDAIYLYRYPITIPRGLIYGVPAAFVFIALWAQESRLKRVSPRNILVKIGDASFSLYLIQVFFFLILPNDAPVWMLAGTFTLAVASSFLVHPFENFLARATKNLLS